MKNVVPEEVLKEIFRRKLKRRDLSSQVYNKLKKMILSQNGGHQNGGQVLDLDL